MTELELHKEELYLRKIIKVVSERSAKQHELKEATGTQKTFISSDPYVEPEAYPESEPEVDQRIFAPLSILDNHKTVPLKAGDAIEYYRTISKAGDKDALTQAIILSVRPGNAPLKLHNDEVLPAGHSVKRIFTRVRGAFVDLRPSATYRSIRSYKLPHSELNENDSLRQLLTSTNSPLDAILERNFAEFERKVKDAGCSEFIDMMTWKPKKPKLNGESSDQKPKKRARLESDANADEKLVVKDADSISDDTIAVLNGQLTKIRSLAGRRRAAATYMTEDMLELAIQVREQFLSTDVEVNIDDLAKKLDISEYSLMHFLGGGEGRLVRLAVHEETKAALQQCIGEQRQL